MNKEKSSWVDTAVLVAVSGVAITILSCCYVVGAVQDYFLDKEVKKHTKVKK